MYVSCTRLKTWYASVNHFETNRLPCANCEHAVWLPAGLKLILFHFRLIMLCTLRTRGSTFRLNKLVCLHVKSGPVRQQINLYIIIFIFRFFQLIQPRFKSNPVRMSSTASSEPPSTKAAVLKFLDDQQRPFSLADICEKVKDLGKSSVAKWVFRLLGRQNLGQPLRVLLFEISKKLNKFS